MGSLDLVGSLGSMGSLDLVGSLGSMGSLDLLGLLLIGLAGVIKFAN